MMMTDVENQARIEGIEIRMIKIRIEKIEKRKIKIETGRIGIRMTKIKTKRIETKIEKKIKINQLETDLGGEIHHLKIKKMIDVANRVEIGLEIEETGIVTETGVAKGEIEIVKEIVREKGNGKEEIETEEIEIEDGLAVAVEGIEAVVEVETEIVAKMIKMTTNRSDQSL